MPSAAPRSTSASAGVAAQRGRREDEVRGRVGAGFLGLGRSVSSVSKSGWRRDLALGCSVLVRSAGFGRRSSSRSSASRKGSGSPTVSKGSRDSSGSPPLASAAPAEELLTPAAAVVDMCSTSMRTPSRLPPPAGGGYLATRAPATVRCYWSAGNGAAPGARVRGDAFPDPRSPRRVDAAAGNVPLRGRLPDPRRRPLQAGLVLGLAGLRALRHQGASGTMPTA